MKKRINIHLWRSLGRLIALFTFSPVFATSVETDCPWYLAGEAMTLSITAGNAIIAYAELCDTHSLAAGVAISIDGTRGTGIIQLPSDLHSGYYVLSVYTRDNANVSRRLVAVINPLRSSEADDIEWVAITHPDSLSYAESASVAGSFEENSVREPDPLDIRETEGHVIKARIRNVHDGRTYKREQIRPALSIVGKQIHYFEGKMVNDTTAVFYTFGLHGRLPLVLSATTSSGEGLPIEVLSPYAALIPQQLPHLVFHYKRSEVEARSLDMQRHQKRRQQASSGTSADQGPVPVILDYDDTLFDTTPDISYNLDEYRQFLTVREVLIEYVEGVRSKRKDGRLRLFVRNKDGYDSQWPAMVLIDGMPVNDVERLLNYDARRLHYINIYGSQYTFGNGVYNGILSFITRSGQLTNYPTEPNMQYLVYDFPE